MSKFIYILILFFISCGSIQKNKTSLEKENNSETNSGSNSFKLTDSDNFILEPIELGKPIFKKNSKGETETYYNTRVINSKVHTKEIVHDTIVKKEQNKENFNHKEKETDNQFIWMMFFGFLVVIILIFKK